MTKKTTKHIIPLFFLFLFIILFAQISSVQAAIDFDAQVIDQIGFSHKKIGPNSIGNLINAIYTYALGIVGILATVVMMYGGVLYITAAGNASKMDNAKQWIFSSLTGLILALSSYTLLYMVNPNLLTMTAIKLETPSVVDMSNHSECYWKNRVDLITWDEKDESYCPGSANDHIGLLCACKKKKKESAISHKECRKQGALPSGYTYHCQLVSGEGEDACTMDGQCNENNSN
ncbi:MAG: pilin [Patescibacteria group bacterium]|nr:pilin [Patescibacteria group bacterium]